MSQRLLVSNQGLQLSLIRWLTAATLLSAFLHSAAAQDVKWLQTNRRDNPARVEGLLDQPNGRREYNVLSLLALPSHAAAPLFPQTPESLYVHFCRETGESSAAENDDPAYITVRQLSGHANYLMKATSMDLGTPQSQHWSVFSWPTGDVIRKNGIDVNKLGVIVHLGENNDYAPAMAPVYFSASKAGPPEPISRYVMALRVQHSAISHLSYTLTDKNEKTIQQCSYQNELHPCASNGSSPQTPIEDGSLIHLDLDMTHAAPGPVTLQVDGVYLNETRKLSATFHFVHEPSCR